MNGQRNRRRKSEQHVTNQECEDSFHLGYDAMWMDNRIRTFGRKMTTLSRNVEF